jgi:steroid delta-isomerase-like uncharacterized protein
MEGRFAGMATASPPGTEELTRAYLEAWNSRDPRAVASFFAQDGVYDDRGAAEIVRGPAQIQAHAGAVMAAFPDLRFELERVAEGDGFTCGHWRASMTHGGELFGLRATGRRLTGEGVDVATLDERGKVTHLVSFYDGAQIMRDLGLLPAHGSRLERALVRASSLLRRG